MPAFWLSWATLRQFITDRRGVTALEYSLLAGTIALALMSVLEVPAHELMGAATHFLRMIAAHKAG
jgi:Flp pilus assembly pilin Flp